MRWRRDRRPAASSSLLTTLMLVVVAAVTPASAIMRQLTCMACIHTTSTTQLDNFRVATRLSRPHCLMEPIRCDRDQDVCVTITMHIGGGEYWLGSGCDRRVNFQHMSCQNVRTVSRNVQLGQVHERRAMQRVCVCATDMCNSSRSQQFPLYFLLFLYLLLLCHT